MQHIEQQRLQELGKLRQAFEVEALQALERQRVLGVVEERRVGAALDPPVQVLRQAARQHVGERDQAALRRVEGIDVLDRLVEIPVLLHRELMLPTGLQQHAHEREEEVQVLLRRLAGRTG